MKVKIVSIFVCMLLITSGTVFVFENSEVKADPDGGGDNQQIGYELIDNNAVLHIWNKHNSYYFNISNGIQLTNHYNEYWSHNVLMLGYYNDDEWNLLYRTDHLTGFNKDIDTDNETYVNATLWKDLTYNEYDFRLAIRYHLKVNDYDLTIIPYIKNLGQAIPYVLGFGWELKDIKIANTTKDNYLQIYNGTGFEKILLNQTLDRNFPDMDFNTTIKFICTNPPTHHSTRSLYLSWNRDLTYKVTVKSRLNQYNAPTTLFIRVGTLDVDQEKFTMMHWLDSDDWLGISSSELDSFCGEDNPGELEGALDGLNYWDHSTLNEDHWFILDLGQTYTIKKVRGRSYTTDDPTDVDIYVSDSKTEWDTAVATGINTWQDTNTWQEVDTTDKNGRYIKVEISDTEDPHPRKRDLSFGVYLPEEYFTIFDAYGDIAPPPNDAPTQSNQKIWNTTTKAEKSLNATDVDLYPATFNVTISDPQGDNMTIDMLTNESGSWTFVNEYGYYPLSNGTYSFTNTSWIDSYNTTYYISFNLTDGIDWCNETYHFTTEAQHGWFKIFADDGFGKASNLFTRGTTIYKDEMYIGTQNHNLSKLKLISNGFLTGTRVTMANGSYKNIEDIESGDIVKSYDIGNDSYVNANVTMVFNFTSEWLPDNYLKFNDQLCVSPVHLLYVNGTLMKAEDAQVGDYFTDVNSSNVTITSTANMSENLSVMYNFLIAVNGSEEPLLPNNLTYFAEDVQVSPWGFSNYSKCNYSLLELLLALIGTVACKILVRVVSEISEGCEIWKYNYTANSWTQMVGDDGIEPAGFGDHCNAGIGEMIEFDGSLYVGTGHYNGCEIWRYNGSSWEQVVGKNATIGRGFNDSDNVVAATMKVFTNSSNVTHLYVGTINMEWWESGFCQIWRTADGENWTKVVDQGFRDNGAHEYVRNGYLWSMEVFQDKLYAGTFNIPLPEWPPYPHRGCQLWRSGTGNACDWEKVSLPGGDGFGEHKNYGIRNLVNWSNNLYVGVAASALQVFTKKALEIWRYDGSDWTCIVGNDTGADSTDPEYDGFGDYYNKYPWSMIVANDTLWIGTLNHHLQLKIPPGLSEGCEVWCYNGTNMMVSVEDVNGEKDNGFGQWFNRGARTMIEYPEGSGNVIVGTMSIHKPFGRDINWEEGCEIWMWYS